MTFAPNQTLIYVPKDLRWSAPREVVVERVGRKWAHLKDDKGRVNMETLEVDGGKYTSPGRCFGSWSEYEETTALNQAWHDLRQHLSGWRPRDPAVRLADIHQAAALLRLPALKVST